MQKSHNTKKNKKKDRGFGRSSIYSLEDSKAYDIITRQFQYVDGHY